jgi:hypothetical protein
MSKIDTLNVQIETAKAELENAKNAHQAAVDALGTALPGQRGTDGQTIQAQAMATAKTTAQLVATATEELALLNQALAAAEAFDASHDALSRKKKALGHLSAAKGLASRCRVAADAIDKALENLATANATWVSACQELKAEASAFYRIALADNQHGRLEQMMSVAGIENTVANAIVGQFDDAMQGVNIYSHGRMSYSRDLENKAARAGNDVRRATENILSAMHGAAMREGVKV